MKLSRKFNCDVGSFLCVGTLKMLYLNLSLLQFVFSVRTVVMLNKKEKDSQNPTIEPQYSIRWLKN